MDTRYFGTNLLALKETGNDSRKPRTEAGEDDYYRRHAPAEGRGRRIPAAALVWIAVVVVGWAAL